jgi:hypothetical protein
MNDRIHRHMKFNKDLKYNKISFKLQIKLLDSKNKFDELIEKSNLVLNTSNEIFERELEIKTPKIMKKDSNVKNHNDEIKEKYNNMKNEFYKFLNLIKILNLNIESVNYTEEYTIE